MSIIQKVPCLYSVTEFISNKYVLHVKGGLNEIFILIEHRLRALTHVVEVRTKIYMNLQFTALNMLNGPTLSKDYVSVSHLDYMAYTENQSGALLLYYRAQT